MEEVRSVFAPFRPAILGVIALLVAAFALRSGLLALAAVLLGVTTFVSYLWSRYFFDRLEYRRTFARSRCVVGEEVELTVELTNRKVLPLTHLTIEDTVPEELQIHARKLAFARVGKGVLRFYFGLAWYQKVIRHYRVTPVKRGFYQVGPATLSGGDPFGYVRRTLDVQAPETLIVYPKVLSLEQVGIPTRRPFGDLKSRDRLFEDPMRFAGVRQYQPGDPLNRIHWKASAVAGDLQVRLLDPSANLGLAIFLNTWGYDMFWQGSETEAIETGCTLAASVANWAVDEGLAVGLYANGLVTGWGLNHLRIPPSRGPAVLANVLEGLARLGMPSRHAMPDMLLDQALGLGYGTSVVVITRLVSDDLAGTLLKVHRSGRPVTLVITGGDPDSVPALPGVRVYHVAGEEALHAAVLS